MASNERRKTVVAMGTASAMLAGALVLPGPATPVAIGADPDSSFYYESDIGDGIGIGRTGYGQTGDADFDIDGPIRIPQWPYQERFSFDLDVPGGGQLVAGQTYTGGLNRLESGGVRHRICSDPSASAHYIHDVSYDSSGAMTMLSMSSTVECGTDGTFHSELRRNTVAPRYGGVLTEPNRYDRLELPSVGIGGHSDQRFTLTAVGSRPVTFGQPAVQGANPAPFSVIDDTCAGGTFEPGQACGLTVRFSPTARGRREADVRLALDTPSGHRDLRVAATGQIPTTTTLSMKKGPYTSGVGITTRLSPVPDDINGHCMTVEFTTPNKETTALGQCDGDGKSKSVVDLEHTRWRIQAVSIATREFASSSSEPRWGRWVRHMDSWATSKVSPSTFFPYPDGYKDRLVISGQRKFDIAVRVVITRQSDGEVMAEASIPKATGDYRFTWDGTVDGAGLAPYGLYDVAVTLTEDQWNEQTFRHEVKLKRQWVKWTKRTKTLTGAAYGLWGRSGTATISKAKSAYARGVRLGSGNGVAVVEYAFPVAKSDIYGWMTFRVRGRSPNGHKAAVALWNPKRGGYRDLANFDAAREIGPKYQWWKTSSDGSFRVKKGKARAAVLVWKGLGRKGPAAFDIKQVQLVYKTGKLMAPSLLSAETSPGGSSVRDGGGPRGSGKKLDQRDVGQRFPWLKYAPPDAPAPQTPPAEGSASQPEDRSELVPAPEEGPPQQAEPAPHDRAEPDESTESNEPPAASDEPPAESEGDGEGSVPEPTG